MKHKQEIIEGSAEADQILKIEEDGDDEVAKLIQNPAVDTPASSNMSKIASLRIKNLRRTLSKNI